MGSWLYSRPALVCLAATAVCGALGWSGHAFLLPFVFVFPLAFVAQRNRQSAYGVALTYYAASSWPVVPAIVSFFGPHSNRWLGVSFWLVAASLLAVPWGICYFSGWPARYASVGAALAMTTLPPIGLISWASPLTSAGLLFPGFGWFGIVAIALLPALIVRRPAVGVIATIGLIATAHAIAPREAHRATWTTIDTTLGRQFDRIDPVREFQAATLIQKLALASGARVIIFPETAIPHWNEAVELFWEPLFKALAGRGQTILMGTTIRAPGSRGRLNGVLIRGSDKSAFFIQSVPVPFSMWRPFDDSGFPLRITGPGTVAIAGERAGILICYEMLLAWPVLRLSAEHPTILVGVANDYWARETPVPAVQQMCISAWARLFSVPWLLARNT